MQVKGKEKSYFYGEGEVDEETGVAVADKKYWSYEKIHILFKAVCFRFPLNCGPLNPGDYIIPFEFKLPDLIPASMIFEYGGASDDLKLDQVNEQRYRFCEPHCEVKYSIKAFLNFIDRDAPVVYKQLFVVHENPVEFQINH